MKDVATLNKPDVCIQATRDYNGKFRGDFRYSIVWKGNIEISDATADELRELSESIRTALQDAEEGGGR